MGAAVVSAISVALAASSKLVAEAVSCGSFASQAEKASIPTAATTDKTVLISETKNWFWGENSK